MRCVTFHLLVINFSVTSLPGNVVSNITHAFNNLHKYIHVGCSLHSFALLHGLLHSFAFLHSFAGCSFAECSYAICIFMMVPIL